LQSLFSDIFQISALKPAVQE